MSINIPELVETIAVNLPDLRKQIEEEHAGEMRKGRDHRAYHDLDHMTSCLADDIFDILGPRCTASLVYWLAEKMAEISPRIEDHSGAEGWGTVKELANSRTSLGCTAAPLILEGQT